VGRASDDQRSGEVADLLDGMLDERALVIGSPPPEGSDLDLLLPRANAPAVESILETHGFARQSVPPFRGYPSGFTIWARFSGCGAAVVDSIPLDNLELPPAEADRLFAEARPIPGFDRLVRPAPHHVLLILAHNFLDAADARRPLSDGRRGRVERALAEDPEAGDRARSLAPAWGTGERLARLETAFALGEAESADDRPPRPGGSRARSRVRALRAYRRAWRHGHVVAFSGADRERRAAQADGLARALRALEIPVGVVRPAPPATRLRAATAALARAAALRHAVLPGLIRGEVVICDGYALDAAVELRARYGERRVKLQATLVRALSPPPRRAYLIDTGGPEAGLYREQGAALGVRVLDGARGPDELCAEIASDVWPAVR
jgi:hypothetical protein